MNALEREEELLNNELDNGEITLAEYNKQMQEIQRDYHAAACEAADNAYQEEMERW